MVIVQRAKQILDFVLTFHFFHLLISWKTSHHFPTGTAWWVLQVVNIAIMTLGGEWACMHREMKPILTTGGQKKSKTSMSHDPVASTSQSLDTMSEEMGKRLKRKVSDAEQKEDDDTDTHVDHQQGALLAAVGKAKKAIISNNSRPKRHGKQKYDQIPLDELDNDNSSSMIK
ncbi:integral membrane protein S linking to the trans Golgi network-domain-containing protein [Gilbertella persicaria]|uniref:integral membrane protein S linking to the trans Golgi network-domain-containing protein n=1 Tax=Gilbertella persicaria TaxID=101096 RepID=UPI00221F702B|nr:integral membrane protein S linking to the trans Golgi network-domain-containing protein [Gilbertella persicaria]KAI8086958.1 integral membrane protein S linking to the trans Golgi network-domain-containing protein [Gilbertella persicaria]